EKSKPAEPQTVSRPGALEWPAKRSGDAPIHSAGQPKRRLGLALPAPSTIILSPRSDLAEKKFFHARKVNHVLDRGLHVLENELGSVVLREFSIRTITPKPELHGRKVDNNLRLRCFGRVGQIRAGNIPDFIRIGGSDFSLPS